MISKGSSSEGGNNGDDQRRTAPKRVAHGKKIPEVRDSVTLKRVKITHAKAKEGSSKPPRPTKRASLSCDTSSVPKKAKTTGQSSNPLSLPVEPSVEPNIALVEEQPSEQGVEDTMRLPQAVQDSLTIQKNRKFADDFGFPMIDTHDALPDFHTELLERGWLPLTKSWPINATLVREFFAHAYALPRKEQATVSQFVLRGVTVPFNAQEFNSILGIEAIDQSRLTDALLAKNLTDRRKWAAEIVKRDESSPVWKEEGKIKRITLNNTAVAWNCLASNRLMPSKNYLEVPVKRVILVVAIMSKWPVDVGKTIETSIRDKFFHKEDAMPFPGLLTRLFAKYVVPMPESDAKWLAPRLCNPFKHIPEALVPMLRKTNDGKLVVTGGPKKASSSTVSIPLAMPPPSEPPTTSTTPAVAFTPSEDAHPPFITTPFTGAQNISSIPSFSTVVTNLSTVPTKDLYKTMDTMKKALKQLGKVALRTHDKVDALVRPVGVALPPDFPNSTYVAPEKFQVLAQTEDMLNHLMELQRGELESKEKRRAEKKKWKEEKRKIEEARDVMFAQTLHTIDARLRRLENLAEQPRMTDVGTQTEDVELAEMTSADGDLESGLLLDEQTLALDHSHATTTPDSPRE